MIIYYFGADQPWINQDESSINRRNMAILLALSRDENINKVYNVVRCTRALVLNKKQQKKSKNPKIENLYIAPILPERGVLKSAANSFNVFLLNQLNKNAFLDVEKSVSWCYWPQGFKDYKYLRINNKLVFDTDHNIIDDINISKQDKDKRESVLLEAGKQADLILSSSRSMLDWYIRKNYNNTRLVMNGVFNSRIKNGTTSITKEIYQVTYCGTLSKWIKVEWIEQLAIDQPDWQINIIGKNYKTEIAEKLKAFKNIKLLGFLQPKDVDVILRESDVCFGLYKELSSLDVNSMKIYDYLAAGKPVVINKYHDYLDQDFKDLINSVTNYEEFKKALTEPKKLSMEAVKLFLKQSDWENRIQPIIAELANDE
ncbi:glycosyltransferase family protein [Winogradskyella helgolandensis]|uniref:glycosyltransferase family protein n=1 Tax=Winogradskyella helgolandensis TaxID=2697010 RepID=UPI0015B88545|nr:glycosyltransferase [Winogradskyella helgolandensis]